MEFVGYDRHTAAYEGCTFALRAALEAPVVLRDAKEKKDEAEPPGDVSDGRRKRAMFLPALRF
jgi:hypothetical protein